MKGTAFFTAMVCLLGVTTEAASLSLEGKLEEIDKVIRQTLASSPYVGLSAGIVEDGQIVFAKGYGLRNITDPQSYVTNKTIFGIASVTKGFTAYAMDHLISVKGVADWNDLVTAHIPEFRMSNPHTSTHAKVKDLFSHATGIPRHDASMLYSDFPREDFIKRLPYLETNYYLREKFQYSNIMYSVAGIVIERVSNRSWEENVQQSIFDPLKMKRSYPNITEAFKQGVDDIAQPHTMAFGTTKVIVMPWLNLTNAAPSGSIVSTAEDMGKWIQTQLKLSNRSQVMHVPHMNAASRMSDQYDFAYGYAWTLGYYRGQSVVWHNGGIDGFSSYVVLFPASNRGIVLLANADFASNLTLALPYAIADILASNGSDYTARKMLRRTTPLLHERDMLPLVEVKEIPVHEPVANAEQYGGCYENPGYGEIEVSHVEHKLFATYNTILYALTRKNATDVFSATATWPRAMMYECSFVLDSSSGDVIGVRFVFETAAAPIHFEKKLPTSLTSLAYLKSFAGTYSYFEFTVSRGRKVLVVSAPTVGELPFADGQELKPYKEDWFLLEDGNYLFEFGRLDSGEVFGLQWHVGELTIPFNKTIFQ